MKLLFVCYSAENRSPTLADMYADKHETKAIGLYHHFEYWKVNKYLEYFLKWCDRVFVVEQEFEDKIRELYHELAIVKKIVNLDIPDNYYRGEEALKNIIKLKMEPYES